MSAGAMSHHDLRLDHMSREVSRLPREACQTVVLLGDAFMERNPSREFGNRTVINMGIEGDFVISKDHEDQCLNDRIRLLPLARPADIIIAAGGEDIRESLHPGEIIERLDALIDSVQKAVPGVKIHICSLPPLRDPYTRLMPMTAVLNGLMETLAEQRALHFIDLFSILEDDNSQLDAKYSEDGLHLNESGYEVVNELFSNAIVPC